MLLEELDEALDGSCAVVVDGLVLVSGGPELDGREAADLNTFNIVGGGIELGNDHGRDVGELLGKLLVLGGKRLAVAAPRGVELNEDILASVESDLGKVGANKSANMLVGVLLGDGLGLEVSLDVTSEVVCDEGTKVGDITIVLVLLHVAVLAHLEHEEHREVLSLEAKVLEHLLLVLVDGDKDSLALELLSELAVLVLKRLEVSRLIVDKVESLVGNLGAEDLLDGLVVEREHKRKRMSIDELGEGSLRESTSEIVALLIKVLEESHAVSLAASSSSHTSISDDSKGEVVVAASSLDERGLCSTVSREETNHSNLIVLLESLNLLSGIQRSSRRTNLLLDPVDDFRSDSATSILAGNTLLEPLESRVTSDGELLTEFSFLRGIDLCQHDLLTLESRRCLCVLRSKTLAMPAPWRVELHKHKLIVSKHTVKVLLGQHNNIGLRATAAVFVFLVFVVIMRMAIMSRNRKKIESKKRKKKKSKKLL
eukprot:comp21691_c0_seq2/m.48213 comp21691_c0_seq2/g.48213  ORF comp21691_c0_seq2/g.48213 comp21691_c0_seq2/m.48213 type:complete len:484 (+) comp21691_c0_seq2:150-1601(+)